MSTYSDPGIRKLYTGCHFFSWLGVQPSLSTIKILPPRGLAAYSRPCMGPGNSTAQTRNCAPRGSLIPRPNSVLNSDWSAQVKAATVIGWVECSKKCLRTHLYPHIGSGDSRFTMLPLQESRCEEEALPWPGCGYITGTDRWLVVVLSDHTRRTTNTEISKAQFIDKVSPHCVCIWLWFSQTGLLQNIKSMCIDKIMPWLRGVFQDLYVSWLEFRRLYTHNNHLQQHYIKTKVKENPLPSAWAFLPIISVPVSWAPLEQDRSGGGTWKLQRVT